MSQSTSSCSSMSETKHEMLFQGINPGQQQTEQPSTSIALSATATAPPLDVSLPPTYDDAMSVVLRCPSGRSCAATLPQAQPDNRRSVYCASMPCMEILSTQSQGAPSAAMPAQAPPAVDFGRLNMPQARSPQPKLGPHACLIMCPACGQHGLTRLRLACNRRTRSWSICLCSLGWCCCACLLPYMLNGWYTTYHYCRNCSTYLGAYQPKSCI